MLWAYLVDRTLCDLAVHSDWPTILQWWAFSLLPTNLWFHCFLIFIYFCRLILKTFLLSGLESDIWFVNEPNRSFEPVLFSKPFEPVRLIERRLGQLVSVPNAVNNSENVSDIPTQNQPKSESSYCPRTRPCLLL